eukprot:Polyplicarium_translucidae@DN727_c0_g1_i1.p1
MCDPSDVLNISERFVRPQLQPNTTLSEYMDSLEDADEAAPIFVAPIAKGRLTNAEPLLDAIAAGGACIRGKLNFDSIKAAVLDIVASNDTVRVTWRRSKSFRNVGVLVGRFVKTVRLFSNGAYSNAEVSTVAPAKFDEVEAVVVDPPVKVKEVVRPGAPPWALRGVDPRLDPDLVHNAYSAHIGFITCHMHYWNKEVMDMTFRFNVPDHIELLSSTYIKYSRDQRDNSDKIDHSVAMHLKYYRSISLDVDCSPENKLTLTEANDILARASCAYVTGYKQYFLNGSGSSLCYPWLVYGEHLQELKEKAIRHRDRDYFDV